MGFCCLTWILRVTAYMLEYLTCLLQAVRCGAGLTGDSRASGGPMEVKGDTLRWH